MTFMTHALKILFSSRGDFVQFEYHKYDSIVLIHRRRRRRLAIMLLSVTCTGIMQPHLEETSPRGEEMPFIAATIVGVKNTWLNRLS